MCTIGRETNLLETKTMATERCGSPCGVPMCGPHAGSPCGVTMWDPDLRSPCGIPMWGPQKLPICGITKINFLRTIFLRSRNAQRDCCCCCRYWFFFCAVICKSPQIQAQCAAQIGANGRQKFHRTMRSANRCQRPPEVSPPTLTTDDAHIIVQFLYSAIAQLSSSSTGCALLPSGGLGKYMDNPCLSFVTTRMGKLGSYWE